MQVFATKSPVWYIRTIVVGFNYKNKSRLHEGRGRLFLLCVEMGGIEPPCIRGDISVLHV